VQDPSGSSIGVALSEKEAQQYFRLREMLFEFARLFDYGEASERAVAIVGPAFLDTLLTETLANFLVDDAREVHRLIRPEGPLGTFGAKVSACYCLGLIGGTVTADLRTIAKIRNRFAHDLLATFSDPQLASWCTALRWHKETLGEPPPNATARDIFQVGVNQLVCHLDGLVGQARLHRRQKSQSG
jgi:hypothetical protein